MGDSASKCAFFVEGGKDLGEYLMYNPPITGDDISFGEEMYTVVERNVDVYDNFVRITVIRKEAA